ncbi:formylglycine-generating enzyme family protein [Candidatus Poribacteria bacterium]|nr:formylglycine-generating enzyme family protein [Candidatus Poribacteria bacterium]
MKKRFTFHLTTLLSCSLLMLIGCGTGALKTGTQPTPTAAPQKIIGKDGAEMVLIPAGEFEMGTDASEIHGLVRNFAYTGADRRSGFEAAVPPTVYLDAFYIDVYEVTNAQYKKFVDATGHPAPAYWVNLLLTWLNQPNQPVVAVSWHDAAAYAQWAGKRLPTEAEWEKAARGGLVGKRYPWGDTITHDDANYGGTGGRDQWGFTSPVGSFPPNGYGTYDMAGNGWEWCMDEYDSGFYAKGPKNNPVAGGVIKFVNNDFTNVKTLRVFRGGGWDSHPYYVRVARRVFNFPSFTLGVLGFRCAGNVTP